VPAFKDDLTIMDSAAMKPWAEKKPCNTTKTDAVLESDKQPKAVPSLGGTLNK
jgi:uncharacterized membrane protein (UPF0127 family)